MKKFFERREIAPQFRLAVTETRKARFVLLFFIAITAVFVFSACNVSDFIDATRDAARNEPPRTEDRPPTDNNRQDVRPPADGAALTPAQIFAQNQFAVFQIFAWCADGIGYSGSGFFIDSTGLAVTNHHVMANMVYAVAVLYDDSEFDIVGFYSYDTNNDLAVIRVDGGRRPNFEYAVLGNSDAVRVGELVYAVGGPEGEPITFTDGMISRLVAEPISIDIYTVSGLLQHTAAIYGGNSGGPLLNDRGQVIGINSFVRTDRASVQWAVPSNRINLPAANDFLQDLPLGGAAPSQPTFDGRIAYLTRFNYIPDFLSISRNARLQMSGTPRDLGEAGGILYELYEYLYVYTIPARHWIADTDAFDAALEQRGFIFQNVVHLDGEVWVYLFHPGRNRSISYAFMTGFDTLLMAVGSGDVYTLFYHSGQYSLPSTGQQPAIPTGQRGQDPALYGLWQFWDTTSSSYLHWAGDGEIIYYAFLQDGTGTFFTTDMADTVVLREFPFNWHTVDDVVVIEYTTIDLVLVYYYEVYHDELWMSGANEHLLVYVEL